MTTADPGEDTARALEATTLAAAGLFAITLGMVAATRPALLLALADAPGPVWPWRVVGAGLLAIALLDLAGASREDGRGEVAAVSLALRGAGVVAYLALATFGVLEWRLFPFVMFAGVIWLPGLAAVAVRQTELGPLVTGAAPLACGLLNGVACLVMAAVLRPGTEVNPDLAERAAFIAENPALWRAGWSLWVLSALSLLAFYAWWGAQLGRRDLARGALLLAFAGVCGDLFTESVYIGWFPRGLEEFSYLGSVLTGGWANGWYCVAGASLSAATRWPSAGVGRLVTFMWLLGAGVTIFTVAESMLLLEASMALMMAIFCPLCVWMTLAPPEPA